MVQYWKALIGLWREPVKIITTGNTSIWKMSAAKSEFVIGYMSWTYMAASISLLYVGVIGGLNIYEWVRTKRIKLWLPWVDK